MRASGGRLVEGQLGGDKSDERLGLRIVVPGLASQSERPAVTLGGLPVPPESLVER